MDNINGAKIEVAPQIRLGFSTVFRSAYEGRFFEFRLPTNSSRLQAPLPGRFWQAWTSLAHFLDRIVTTTNWSKQM
jgi:hypothetical protein